jgi:hypothetical protein
MDNNNKDNKDKQDNKDKESRTGGGKCVAGSNTV